MASRPCLPVLVPARPRSAKAPSRWWGGGYGGPCRVQPQATDFSLGEGLELTGSPGTPTGQLSVEGCGPLSAALLFRRSPPATRSTPWPLVGGPGRPLQLVSEAPGSRRLSLALPLGDALTA